MSEFHTCVSGLTIMHPSLMRPVIAKTQPVHTHITHLEPDITDILVSKILKHRNGSWSINNTLNTALRPTVVTYTWRHVYVKALQSYPYVFVIKHVNEGRHNRQVDDIDHRPHVEYHRIDLLPTSQRMCVHMKQLATLDTSVVYLSPASFQRPFEHLSNKEVKRMVQKYKLYLNDNTGLLSNSGIKEGIGKDVSVISRINQFWLDEYRRDSRMRDYIVRRYVATPSGVFYVYPGTLINKLYDPTSRDWYTRAVKYPGMVTVTAPYLDRGGAGYIVTISHTVYEGNAK